MILECQQAVGSTRFLGNILRIRGQSKNYEFLTFGPDPIGVTRRS
jgi:hypothetical protein